MARARLTLLALSCSACAPPMTGAAMRGSCRAEATFHGIDRGTMDVSLACTPGLATRIVATEEDSAPFVRDVVDGSGRALERAGNAWRLRDDARARWTVDLGRTAAATESFDVALRVGRSLVAPVSTWLLQPEPVRRGVPISLSVRTPRGERFVTGLAREGDHLELAEHEVHVATYGVLGEFGDRTFTLADVHGAPATLEVATLDGPHALETPRLEAWVVEGARAVSDFWGGFPTDRALVALVPIAERHGVVFGQVLPESRPGVIVLLGADSAPDDLRRDWVLVHELFHLGFPSFHGEGAWLDEGLATYYEPLIRARRGWLDEREAWAELVRFMPRGVPGCAAGLEQRDDWASTYWGGALVALLTDVAVRRATGGHDGLELGLRHLLAQGGAATEVWRLDRAVAVIDRAFAEPHLAPAVDLYARRGAAVDLAALWRELGISTSDGGLTLDDEHRALRDSVLFGAGRHAPPSATPVP